MKERKLHTGTVANYAGGYGAVVMRSDGKKVAACRHNHRTLGAAEKCADSMRRKAEKR